MNGGNRFGARSAGLRPRVAPIRSHRHATLLYPEHLARPQLPDSPENRTRAGNVAQREIVVEGLQVEIARQVAVDEERLDLGAEDDPIGQNRVVERLHAQTVARDQEAPAPCIPERERKHPVQPGDETVGIVFVEVCDHLRVALRLEHVALGLQICSQGMEVVDLAVQDHPYALVFIRDRLGAGLEIDDGETPDSQSGPAEDDVSVLVGATVDELFHHALDGGARDSTLAAQRNDASDTTHPTLRAASTQGSAFARSLSSRLAHSHRSANAPAGGRRSSAPRGGIPPVARPNRGCRTGERG